VPTKAECCSSSLSYATVIGHEQIEIPNDKCTLTVTPRYDIWVLSAPAKSEWCNDAYMGGAKAAERGSRNGDELLLVSHRVAVRDG
jgi:hypothetical protein